MLSLPLWSYEGSRVAGAPDKLPGWKSESRKTDWRLVRKLGKICIGMSDLTLNGTNPKLFQIRFLN